MSQVAQYSFRLWTGWSGFEPRRRQSLWIQIGSEAHPVSCTQGTRDCFHRGKAWPGHDADCSPPCSAEVKKSSTSSPPQITVACSKTTLPLRQSWNWMVLLYGGLLFGRDESLSFWRMFCCRLELNLDIFASYRCTCSITKCNRFVGNQNKLMCSRWFSYEYFMCKNSELIEPYRI